MQNIKNAKRGKPAKTAPHGLCIYRCPCGAGACVRLALQHDLLAVDVYIFKILEDPAF